MATLPPMKASQLLPKPEASTCSVGRQAVEGVAVGIDLIGKLQALDIDRVVQVKLPVAVGEEAKANANFNL